MQVIVPFITFELSSPFIKDSEYALYNQTFNSSIKNLMVKGIVDCR